MSRNSNKKKDAGKSTKKTFADSDYNAWKLTVKYRKLGTKYLHEIRKGKYESERHMVVSCCCKCEPSNNQTKQRP